jgi:hypothetical protein
MENVPSVARHVTVCKAPVTPPLRSGLRLHRRRGLFPDMVTIEVQIDHGKVTPVGPQQLPESGRGLLNVLAGVPGDGAPAVSIESKADGLPVIRTQGGVITSDTVKKIEGFAGKLVDWA